MKKLLQVLVIALFVSGMSFGAIIDSFGVNQGLISDSSAGATPATAGPTAIGGGVTRMVGTNLTTGATSTSLEIAAGSFFGNTGSGAFGWNGAWYSGLWDLSGAGQGLAIDLVDRDLVGGYVTFWVSDGIGTRSATVFAPAGTGGAFLTAVLSSFSGTAVNLAAVNQVGFAWYNTTASQDVELDNFQTYVPEPGTYALMAAGLIGLFAIRKKKV